MFLTPKMLEEWRPAPCDSGVKWFKRWFPDGGEAIDIINHKYVSPQILHWGYENLQISPQEKKAYWEKLRIKCAKPHTICCSEQIENSEFVMRSMNVVDSDFVISSKNITNSQNIHASDDISNSSCIFNSEFVDASQFVSLGKNITNSYNIVNSKFVLDSNSVIGSNTVIKSGFVGGLAGSNDISESFFIANCKTVDHCLFCTKQNSAHFLLFNQPVSEREYDLIVQQLQRVLEGWLPTLVENGDWPQSKVTLHSPRTEYNIKKQYEALPGGFWNWVKTLPGYSPTILYELTYASHLRKEI